MLSFAHQTIQPLSRLWLFYRQILTNMTYRNAKNATAHDEEYRHFWACNSFLKFARSPNHVHVLNSCSDQRLISHYCRMKHYSKNDGNNRQRYVFLKILNLFLVQVPHVETSEQNLKLLPFFVVVCFSRLDCVPSLALIMRQLGNELLKGRRGQVKRQLAS